MELLKKTKSLCPVDLRVLDAELWEVDGQVLIKKTCPDHGSFEDVYWSDYAEYVRAEQFRDHGIGLQRAREIKNGCPHDCGLCQNHKTHTTLLIMELTNRCNLKCPICFANADSKNGTGDLTKEQIRSILEYGQQINYPLRVRGVGNSGGEPTLREDLPEIIQMERELGYDYILIMTNGIRLAQDIEYFKKIRDLDAWLYLQFDGVSAEPYIKTRGLDLWPMKQKVIENARKIGYDKIALIPTLAKGVNDHQVGAIIRYAAANSDIIKFIVFQPVSFSGRIDITKLKEMRITTPDVMRLAEEQTKGEMKKSDFFSLPMNQTLARIITKGGQNQDFCVHPHCGVISIVDCQKGKLVPVPRFINNQKLYDRMRRAFEQNWSRPKVMWSLAVGSLLNISPKLWFKLLPKILLTRSSKSVHSMLTSWLPGTWLTIGVMHFMDPYNFDLDRVQNCCLHFGVIDRESKPRLIPFCTMNSIHRLSLNGKAKLTEAELKAAISSSKKVA
jgi:hypothetical protein